MAVVMTTVIPASTDMYDSINREMGFPSAVPQGLIAHHAAQTDDGLLIFDIWESKVDFEAFAAEKLAPAMEKVTGTSEGSGIKPTFGELYSEYHR
jgi:hypothetical protein